MIRTSITSASWLKLFTITLWTVLFVLLLRRDFFIATVDLKEQQAIRQASAEEYQSIYFHNVKIGYVLNRYGVGENDDKMLNQEARMNINIAQAVQSVNLKLKATLSANNYLKSFDFSFQSPFYQMQAIGNVTGTLVQYTLITGTNIIKDSFSFKTPPLLATSRRAYLLSENLKEGEKRRIPWFDPFSLTGKESILEYRGEESILINGRVQKLHRFIESFSGAQVNSWLDDAGTVVKEESPAGFVFIKEPKFKALESSGFGDDILSSVAVKVVGKIDRIDENSMQYRLDFPKDAEFDLDGGRQTYLDGVLTVNRENLPTSPAAPTCMNAEEALIATPYIQSDNQEVQKLAETITAGTTSPLQKVEKLASWVYANLEKRPVLGLPDALSTLKSKQGDCNEHAALFAALARASQIPTRVAAGVTLQHEAFYYHAWNEVCLGNSWVSIDSTTNQLPADLSHLRFIVGEMQEQVRIGSLLGTLSIEPLLPSTTN